MKKFAAYILAGCMAMSCIYPYEAELDSIAGTLVVEGDIILGDYSSFTVSWATSVDGVLFNDTGFGFGYGFGNIWVENEHGDVFRQEYVPYRGLAVDLRNAPDDCRYRLHISIPQMDVVETYKNLRDGNGGKNYVSSWREPQKAPTIDAITFEFEPSDNPYLRRPTGNARISMTAPDGASRYFRWDYEEEWQFHANYDPQFDYDFENEEYVSVMQLPGPNYWCWAKSYSSQSRIAIAIGDEKNKIHEHKFMEINTGTGNRFQKRYCVHVIARGISEECYQYLHTLEMNSNSTGDLFAPIPSELRGNIICEEDPDELVLGFIEVSRTSELRAFVPYGNGVYLDRGDGPLESLIAVDASRIPQYYGWGYRPVVIVPTDRGDYMGWAPDYWIDCRAMGGTNVKPDYWED